jgi:probable rRNA maturation factor
MTYDIDIQLGEFSADISQLTAAATTTLMQANAVMGSGLAIQLMDNTEIQALNRQYRGVDAPTDVLSFPSDMPMSAEDYYWGDIAIAMPYATAQAARLGHDNQHTLMLLVVHGTLHLLGYDHDTPDNRAAMWEAQAQALVALGVPLEIVPALEDDGHV